MGTGTQNNTGPDSPNDPETSNGPTKRTIPCILVTYPHEEGLLQQIKGKYIRDPFYKKILDSP